MTPETYAFVSLAPHHRKELCEGSGLSEVTLAKAHCRSCHSASELKAALNWNTMSKRMASGILFEYVDTCGNFTGYRRFKPDNPRTDKQTGKPIKYESPRGQSNRAYFTPLTLKELDDSLVPLFITEGEKKALKADQEGFRCIGLVGVFGWKLRGQETLLPELDGLPWKSREVFIVFDSDAATKENVADAERRLAAQLKNRGAVVKVVRLPCAADGGKVGLDDFLVANPVNEFHKLVNAADDPEAVEAGDSKADARAVDAMREARKLIAATATHTEENEDIPKLRHHRSSFWWWTGSHFREETEGDLSAKVVQWLDQSFYKLTGSAVSNVMLCLKSETNVSAHREMPCWLSGHRPGTWLPVRNGILNVSAAVTGNAGCLEPHTPRFFSANCLPYAFDQNAKCPKWMAFLQRNLEGDAERIAVLQEFYGYCLSSTLTAHKFFFMEGEGANGKSVACAALFAMLGSDNVSSVPLESFGERFALFPTLGKMANVTAEVGECDRVAEGILKSYCSGDAMQFERKFRDSITAKPTAKLVFASNNRPRFSDKSSGLWRRMILMPWRVTIPEAERVRGMDSPQWWADQGELAGILNWSIDGLRRLEQQGGFTTASVCEGAIAEYRAESNPTRMFIEDHFQPNPESWVPCDSAYRLYADWAKACGFGVMSANGFGCEIRRAFPRSERKRKLAAGDRFWAYFGVEQVSQVSQLHQGF